MAGELSHGILYLLCIGLAERERNVSQTTEEKIPWETAADEEDKSLVSAWPKGKETARQVVLFSANRLTPRNIEAKKGKEGKASMLRSNLCWVKACGRGVRG